MLRTEEPSGDPYYHSRVFDGKQRRFEIQIQGKFTVLPTGTVYIGGEITEGPMELGLVTRGLCNMLLSFARRINSAMNYSFGDKAQEELPHIVFPLWTSVDKMVKTKEVRRSEKRSDDLKTTSLVTKSTRVHTFV